MMLTNLNLTMIRGNASRLSLLKLLGLASDIRHLLTLNRVLARSGGHTINRTNGLNDVSRNTSQEDVRSSMLRLNKRYLCRLNGTVKSSSINEVKGIQLNVRRMRILLAHLSGYLIGKSLLKGSHVRSTTQAGTRRVKGKPTTRVNLSRRRKLTTHNSYLDGIGKGHELTLIKGQKNGNSNTGKIIRTHGTSINRGNLNNVLCGRLVNILYLDRTCLPPFVTKVQPAAKVPEDSSTSSTPQVQMLDVSTGAA